MKKFLLAMVLLFSTSEIVKAIDGVDIAIATVVITGSIMLNNQQKSQLKMDAAIHPEQERIYDAANIDSYEKQTYFFAGLSIAGLVICRLCGIPPVLTYSALAATGSSAAITYQQRINVEQEAQIDRIKNKSKKQ